MTIFLHLLLGLHLAYGQLQATNKVDAPAASVGFVEPPASVNGSKTESESSGSVATTNAGSDVGTAASVDSVEPPAAVNGSKTESESSGSVATTNAGSDVGTAASVEPPASVGSPTPATSTNPESPQLFNTAAATLIDQVKSKISGSIPFTLSDIAINVATSDNQPTNRKKSKVRNNLNKLVLKSRSDSEVIDESELEESEDTSNPNKKPGLTKAESSGIEFENLRKIKKPQKSEQREKSQKTAVESEQNQDSKMDVDGAVDHSKPGEIDDFKTVEDKSDELHRSSRKTKNSNNKRRNESSKKPNVERQEESSNSRMVGFTDIAVEEVVVNRKNSRFRVSISCKIGPINVLLTTNSSDLPIASYSFSAPIGLRMGLNTARSPNVVTFQGVKAKQLKINDLKVADGINNPAGILLNEIRQKITKVNFSQMWEEAISSSLKEENVMNSFKDASDSFPRRSRPKVTSKRN